MLPTCKKTTKTWRYINSFHETFCSVHFQPLPTPSVDVKFWLFLRVSFLLPLPKLEGSMAQTHKAYGLLLVLKCSVIPLPPLSPSHAVCVFPSLFLHEPPVIHRFLTVLQCWAICVLELVNIALTLSISEPWSHSLFPIREYESTNYAGETRQIHPDVTFWLATTVSGTIYCYNLLDVQLNVWKPLFKVHMKCWRQLNMAIFIYSFFFFMTHHLLVIWSSAARHQSRWD